MAEIDGRTTGSCHGKGGSMQSLNVATVWHLPAVFVAETNSYA